jgi:small-conductance mechanosensitive channel
VWWPNQQLALNRFSNLSKSGNKGEAFKVLVDLDTPASVLEAVRVAAEAAIKEDPKEFNGVVGVTFRESASPLKMALNVYWEYSHAGTDLVRWVGGVY